MNIEFHPAAALFPMMDDADLQKLGEDIRENGQLEPITIYCGAILDGRNRYRACGLMGIEPRFREVDGELKSPVAYVLSHNLHRRHLTIGQRAAIAADMIPMLAEEAKQRQLNRDNSGKFSPSVPVGTNGEHVGRSREAAAKALGVGATTVARAVRIKEQNPEAFEKLKRGEIGTWAADPGTNPKFNKTSDTFEIDSNRKRQIAEKQKERMIHGLSVIGGVCHGLETLDAAAIVAASTKEELSTWIEKAFEHSRHIRIFAANLRHKGHVNGQNQSQDAEDACGSVDSAS